MNLFHKIGIAISIACFAYAVYVGYILWREYRKTDATKTRVARAVEAAKNSQTILWNQFVIIVSGIVSQIDNVADFFNMPQIKDFVDQWFTPKTVAAIMLGIAVVSIRMRMRPASKDPLQ